MELTLLTGLFSIKALNIIIAALSFDARFKSFKGCNLSHAYRNARREVEVKYGWELNLNGIKLPQYFKNIQNNFSDVKIAYIKFVIIYRLQMIFELITDEKLILNCYKRSCRVISFRKSFMQNSPDKKFEIVLKKDEVKIVEDFLNGHSVKELIDRFGIEKVEEIIGTPADPFVTQLRPDAIKKSNEIKQKMKSKEFNLIDKEENDIEKILMDIWKSIGEEP